MSGPPECVRADCLLSFSAPDMLRRTRSFWNEDSDTSKAKRLLSVTMRSCKNKLCQAFVSEDVLSSHPTLFAQRTCYSWEFASFGHVSFEVGYSLDYFLCNCGCFVVSGVGMVGHFVTFWCGQHFKKMNFRQNPVYPADLSSHSFGVAFVVPPSFPQKRFADITWTLLWFRNTGDKLGAISFLIRQNGLVSHVSVLCCVIGFPWIWQGQSPDSKGMFNERTQDNPRPVCSAGFFGEHNAWGIQVNPNIWIIRIRVNTKSHRNQM